MSKRKKPSTTQRRKSKTLKSKHKPLKQNKKQNRKTRTKKPKTSITKSKQSNLNFNKMNNGKTIIGIFSLILLVVLGILSGKMWETVDADEVVVIQDPVDGELHFFVGGTETGGLVFQNFGTPTHYKKSFQFWFSKDAEEGNGDKSIKIRFNDGGHASISGSVRINLPIDQKNIIKLHTIFGSQASIEQALVRPTIEKSIYMTGPLMSSRESFAEKRNSLLTFIEDQATHGVYKTISAETKIKDALSGEEKTITEVKIVEVDKIMQRNSASPLKEFNVVLATGTLAFKSIDYDGNVEKQIEQQQQAIMSVQLSMATAKKAEQDAITVAKQGEASAAKAKWEMEVTKAKLVTEGEMKLAVQKLATTQAELYKQQQILEGQGEAEKKKLIMFADGALDKKLATMEAITASWADAYAKRNVPVWYQSGGNGGNTDNEFSNFMNMANIANAKQLGLDLSIPKGGNK